MNTLFSLLMQGNEIPESFSWYAKRTEEVVSSDRITALVGKIMTGVHTARMAIYASVVCNMVMQTQYGPEIKALDPDNTYVPVTRPKEVIVGGATTAVVHSDPDYCMHDLIQPISAYRSIKSMLEDDIAERLDDNSWFDLMGAACLQLLREVNK